MSGFFYAFFKIAFILFVFLREIKFYFLGCRKLTYYTTFELETKPFLKALTYKKTLKGACNKSLFGFNGMEKDDEIFNSTGTSYTAEFWRYDSRLGRRWNLDPKPNPSISQYATFSLNPIMFTDLLGDTIRKTDVFSNDEHAMQRYNLWEKSRAGKKFIRRYGVGGKYENVSIVFDLVKESGIASGKTITYAFDSKNNERTLVKGDGLKDGEFLRFKIFLDNRTTDFKSNKPWFIREMGLTIVHETQHIRINHYSCTIS